MDYYKNLLTQGKKSKLRIIFGFVFIIISVLWIVIRLIEENPIRIFDWFYSIIFSLNGILHIVEGCGISINSYFGKAFIQINEEEIQYKPNIRTREINVKWNKISEIHFKTNRIEIVDQNNSSIEFLYSKLGFAVIQEIKDIIIQISKNKNILIKA
jgi:hypothetical protein